MLTLTNLTVSVADTEILHSFSYTFKPGMVYALMGPNGSGKSTLASVIAGNPTYVLDSKSSVTLQDENITDLEPHERARQGIFLSFQNPLSISGITAYQLSRYALKDRFDALTIRKKVQAAAKKVHISEDMLSRSLNEGFSGGERKKMEVLQALVLDPQILLFDEIDTGVDVDALKTIGSVINDMKAENKIILLITHYSRLFRYIKPDHVLIMDHGSLKKEGDFDLVKQVEDHGYTDIS